MNPFLRLLLAAVFSLFPLAAPSLRATPEPANAPKVKLTFVDWEKFSDIAVGGTSDKGASDLIYGELNRHLVALARRYLAPGQTLVVTMKDIDLAGVVEPWRGPDFGHIRYMRDTHPPRLTFEYQILDAAGAVLQEGSEKLTNLAFRYQTPSIDRETTYYEKQLLSDWMGSTFTPQKKAKKKP